MAPNQNTAKKMKSDEVSATSQKRDDREVQVLYQKLGNQWYAFSLVDDEVFMAAVSEDVIQDRNPVSGFVK